MGRSLSHWDCQEIARTLTQQGVVTGISGETVRRILAAHQLKPWRYRMWLTPSQPRDEKFKAQVAELVTLYTRPLAPYEMVICVDEKTSLQPRPRRHPTIPAAPGRPNLVEHEYRRQGAVHLFAAFNTRTGQVHGRCYRRKRQKEFIAFLTSLDKEIPASYTVVHLVCDNLSVHKGKEVQAWLAQHPRFVLHFTPVHCSWMNQIEQWFSILQRKRLRIVDFASPEDLITKLYQFIAEWNEVAHPFNWAQRSQPATDVSLPQAA